MEQYDSTLLGILQNEGKVAPFLNVILGFLYRRTDFFRIMKTETDKLGFPPGVAKKLLMNIFSTYEMQAEKDVAKIEAMKKEKEIQGSEQRQSPSLQTSSSSPKSKPEETLSTPKQAESLSKNTTEDKKCDGEKSKEEDGATVEDVINTNPVIHNDQDNRDIPQNEEDNSKEMEDNEDPEQARQRRLLQANPLTYNGAEQEKYLWSQNITEVDLRVKIPKYVVKGKQVKVDISKKHIRASHQKEDGSWSVVIDDNLAWEIRADESVWTLTAGEFVHINMEKKEERWWECAFEGEAKINTRKIDCSRPMTDLDDEAQAKIEEMMYNQRQKQMGLPQSHEQKTHDMLRKAWDAEGSPFKGQPFDPSRFNVDSNGVVNMNQP